MSLWYPRLEHLLVIGEQVLDVPAEELAKLIDIPLAESALASPAASFDGHEFYPDLVDKAVVLCSHLAKNHPMSDGNKRLAYVCMTVFLQMNGYVWSEPDPVDVDKMIRAVAGGDLNDEALSAEFVVWVREHARAGRSA